MTTLTDADRRLLRLLQEDCRLSNQELAERAGMSSSACWRRVRALEEAGVIRGYVALATAEKLGLAFSAVVHVGLTRHDHTHVETFISRVAERPEVLECLATTGEADYHLRVVCADKEAYNRFLEEFLFRLPGIAQVRTSLVLKEVKLETSLPV
jgi:DNA-binding Lrp family transcriptional regulator